MRPERGSAAAGAGRSPTRITLAEANGPILVEGPVELVLADGTTVRSDRPVVALCACRSSDRYPFCDTTHRRRVRLAERTPQAEVVPAITNGRSSEERPASQAPRS